MFEHQDKLSGPDAEKFLDSAVTNAGGDLSKAKSDMQSQTVLDHLKADKEEAQKFGFTGTPGFIVAGVSVRGAHPVEDFANIINKRLEDQNKK